MRTGVCTGVDHGIDEFKVAGKPVLSVIRRPGVIKQRKVYNLPGVEGPRFIVHNQSLANSVRAVLGRVLLREVDGGLVAPPQPDPGSWLSDMKGFRDLLRGRVVVPSSVEEFLDMYAGDRRQRVYQQAHESLLNTPVSRRDAWIKAFVKAEKVALKKNKLDPCPRLIQPRSPRYNLCVGRFLKALEPVLYKQIERRTKDTHCPVHIAKGRNAGQTGKLFHEVWSRFEKPCAISMDASRFDQHVSKDALQWEHAVYLDRFRGQSKADLVRLLGWQVENKGVVYSPDGKVKYKTSGSRMSGDMNTALGNVLIMCAMCWTWAHKQGVRCEVIDNGDDVVYICELKDRRKLEVGLVDQFKRWGFTMEVEKPVTVLEKIEFCQTQPVLLSSGYVMVRDPRVCLAKDLTSVQPLHFGYRGYLTAVGVCGHNMYADSPVLGSFYKACIREGKGVQWKAGPLSETGFARLARGMVARDVPISDASRVSFWKAFGILPSDQVVAEEQMCKLSWDDGVAQVRDNHTPIVSQVRLVF